MREKNVQSVSFLCIFQFPTNILWFFKLDSYLFLTQNVVEKINFETFAALSSGLWVGVGQATAFLFICFFKELFQKIHRSRDISQIFRHLFNFIKNFMYIVSYFFLAVDPFSPRVTILNLLGSNSAPHSSICFIMGEFLLPCSSILTASLLLVSPM